jgi:hypothetical protein
LNTQAPQYFDQFLGHLEKPSNPWADRTPAPGTSRPGADPNPRKSWFNRSSEPPIVSHYNIQPVVDIYGAAEGKDLGYVAAEVQKAIDGAQKIYSRAAGSFCEVRCKTMKDSFTGLFQRFDLRWFWFIC